VWVVGWDEADGREGEREGRGKGWMGTYCADILVVEEDGVVSLRRFVSNDSSGLQEVLAGMMECDSAVNLKAPCNASRTVRLLYAIETAHPAGVVLL